jgi:hypothetical protein
MTAPFTGKPIAEAYFSNEANDTIQVVYNEGTDEVQNLISVYVPATDFNNYMLKALLAEGFDFERIARNTINRKRYEAAMWSTVYKKYAAEEVKAIKLDYQQKLEQAMSSSVITSGDILSAVLTYNEDTDALFRAKLAVFELPEVKTLKDRVLKQQIRTAKTFLQLFTALKDVMEK